MLESAQKESPADRPPFMAVLGLLPPYDLEDVKAAFRDKAFVAHPDRGGNAAEFIRLKEAYDHAVEYVATFRGSRREWLAAQVEPYLQQEEVIAEVLRRGGRVEVEQSAWMESAWGEGFAYLAERLRTISVRDMADGDAFLKFLVEHRPPYLVGLDIAGSRISADGLRRIAHYEILRTLDVSGTSVDRKTLQSILRYLPALEWLNVKRTRISMLGRWLLRRAFPQLRVVAQPLAPLKAAAKTMVLRKDPVR